MTALGLAASLAGCPDARSLQGEVSEDDAGADGGCPDGGCDGCASDADCGVRASCATDGNCGPGQTCEDTAEGFECVCEETPSQCPVDDEPSAFCTPDGVERHCVADSDGCIYIDNSQDVNCASIDRTCFNNQCRGSCAAGTYQCDSSGRSQYCGGDGEWGQPVSCSPGDICEYIDTNPNPGQCVDNPLLYFGRNSASGGTEITLRIHDLYAQPVIPDTDVDLLSLGLLTTPNSVGGTVVFSLNADAGGRPGTLLAVGNQSRNLGLPGAQTMPAANSIRLTAGTRYWIVASFDEDTANGEDIRIYRYDAATGPEGDYQSERIIYPVQQNLSTTDLDQNSGAVSLYIVTDR